jgi:Cytochrome c
MERTLKLRRILFSVVLVVLVLAVLAINFTIGWRPIIGARVRPLRNDHFEATPERVARGRILVSLSGCKTCHSEHDWTTHGAPTVPGTELAGLVLPLKDLPGRIVSSNITPDPETGAGNWTDDQLARAIREGIGHDGRTIFPMMPYAEYSYMSDEDLKSVVVYLRSLQPVRNVLPPTEVKFPVNRLILSAPEPITQPVSDPPAGDQVARGKYLVRLGCGCHTPADRGQDIPGMKLAGGEVLRGPWGEATSQNLTPDATGIGYYDEALFLKTIHTGYIGARKLNSIMPFGEFKNLPDDDLKAMFAYLRTVPPVKHHVDNSLLPTYCKLCRQKHGGGDQN